MTNDQLLKKMSQDMEMRNFSYYTYDFYIRKTKEMIKYFNKPLEISNERIMKIESNEVTFKWRDYKDNNKMKEMTIKVEEFIRRFLIQLV